MTQNRWVVPSESTPNKQYEVVRVGDLFACSCPDAVYRDRECKHIRKIKAMLEEEKEDKMDEEYFSRKEVSEERERMLKNKGGFIPLERI